MNRKKLLRNLLQGKRRNVPFSDLLNLVAGFGFRLVRRSGSHHILIHPEINDMLNLQPDGKDAKSYQIQQFLDLVEANDLRLED